MKIHSGSLLNITHKTRGVIKAVADADFDPTTCENWPLREALDESIAGIKVYSPGQVLRILRCQVAKFAVVNVPSRCV